MIAHPEALLISDMAKWNSVAQEIAILRKQSEAVRAANNDCVDHFNALMEERNELLAALKELLSCPAGDYDTTDDYANACKRAEAAIAKAEA